MTYTDQFHKEYLAQQNISDLQQDCGVDHNEIILLDESATYWIVKVLADGRVPYLCILWKETRGYIPRPMYVIDLTVA